MQTGLINFNDQEIEAVEQGRLQAEVPLCLHGVSRQQVTVTISTVSRVGATLLLFRFGSVHGEEGGSYRHPEYKRCHR